MFVHVCRRTYSVFNWLCTSCNYGWREKVWWCAVTLHRHKSLIKDLEALHFGRTLQHNVFRVVLYCSPFDITHMIICHVQEPPLARGWNSCKIMEPQEEVPELVWSANLVWLHSVCLMSCLGVTWSLPHSHTIAHLLLVVRNSVLCNFHTASRVLSRKMFEGWSI